MKEIYMLCNAHLDPVWQWQRREGIAEAISTFRVAADFCEEYDGFIFNHNESLLYEWVEEYEPELFERIVKLVKDGKWKIMGGWYLQPDCLMPSGESIIRQIETGNEYFAEKFGVKPQTAINFDSFGHSRGLVQILKKCGYNSYIFMRPYNFVPERDCIWQGYDGSRVLSHCIRISYNSNPGNLIQRIESTLEKGNDGPNLLLWGIGDHGGGPSKIDLDSFEQYKKDNPQLMIKHSSCEEYFSKIAEKKMRTADESFVNCMVGCYTTMARVKQKHRMLENEIKLCENMIAVSGIKVNDDELKSAEKALLFSEFHDAVTGTSIKKVEEDLLRLLDYGREIAAKYCDKAFFRLCAGQKKCKNGEIPVIVYNPNPYCTESDIEIEFQLEKQNWNEEVTLAKVYDENGKLLPSQNEQEDGNMNLDWRKKTVFHAELKPMSINRFNCKLYAVKGKRRPVEECMQDDECYIFKNEKTCVKIGKRSGMIEKYEVDGKDYLNSAAKILVYKDNEDPWAMDTDGFYDCIGEFECVSGREFDEFNGYSNDNPTGVRVIENGEVRLKVQSLLKYDKTYAVVTYTIPKNGAYADMKIKILSANTNVLYKLSFDTALTEGDFVGQQIFGKEKLLKDEKECVYQKWCGIFENGTGFAVLNKGTHGGSSKDGIMNISLMRTPVYMAHPINGRNIVDTDRCHEHIDMGEREFEFRITAAEKNLDAQADKFNLGYYALPFFPSGMGKGGEKGIELDNRSIAVSRFAKNRNGDLIIRLFNSENNREKTKIRINKQAFDLSFEAFEVKTLKYDDNGLAETEMICI